MTVAGIVLCGGASRRMGRPKALLDFDGEPLLCRVVRVVSQIVSPVIVVAGPKQTLPELPTGTLIGRDLVEYAGPLVGLAAGLALMPPSASHAFVTACDMPFITANLVRLFVSFAQPNRLLMPVIRNERQPLPGIYPMVITTTIQNQLQAGNSSLRSLWRRAAASLALSSV